MAEYGNINSGLATDGGEENEDWGAGVYVQMHGTNGKAGDEKKVESEDDQDCHYLEINDAKNAFEMTKIHEENEEETYANVAEEIVVPKKIKGEIKSKEVKSKEVKNDTKKTADNRKHNNKSHFYSMASLPGKKPSAKPGRKDESFYSYASPDFAPGNSLEKKEAPKESPNYYLKPKPSPETTSKAASLSSPKSRSKFISESPPRLAPQQSYVEPYDSRLSGIEEQNYAEPNEKESSFLGSLGNQSTNSTSSLIKNQASSQPGTKKRTNLMYEKTDPSGKPKDKQKTSSSKKEIRPTANYYNYAIKSSARWRAFIVIVCIMIILSSVMLAFQVLGMSKKKCCHNKDQEFAINKVDRKVKYLEAQMLSRSKEISALQRLTDYQQIQIDNLKNLIKLKQSQQNQRTADAALRNKRNIAVPNYKKKVVEEELKWQKKNGELGRKITEANLNLVDMINNIKLTRGPKGVTGPRGQYSFKGCAFVTKTANDIIGGDLNLFKSNVEMSPPQGHTVTGVVCSSPYAKGTFITPGNNGYKCTCNHAYSQGNGKSIECTIIIYICPTID